MVSKFKINPHTGQLDRVDDPSKDVNQDNIIDKAETLDDGEGNIVTAVDAKDAVDKKHEAYKIFAGNSYIEVDNEGLGILHFVVNNQELLKIDTLVNLKVDLKTDRWQEHDSNTFIGINVVGAGNLVSGAEYNTAVGYNSLYSITNGYLNTALGHNSLYKLTTGYRNIAIGYKALYENINGRNNVAVGYGALLYDVGYSDTAVGYSALVWKVSGIENTAIGQEALAYMQDGSLATNITNCSGLGYDARVSGNNQVQLGNNATTVYAYGAVQDRSDERDKIDIINADLGLEFITALRPIKFRWDYREDYFDKETSEEGLETLIPVEKDGSRKRIRFHYGLIAQEVKQVMDDLGIDFGGYQDHTINGGKDVKTIGYQELIAPMIKAIQELKEKNDLLEARILALE